MKKFVLGLLTVIVAFNVTAYGSAADLLGTSSTSQAESTKSIEAIDKALTASEYKVRDTFYSLSDNSVNRATSEHFQMIWGNGDTTETVNLDFVKGNLANLESIRSFYIDKFGLNDIGTSQNPSIKGKYKTNVYISNTGLKNIEDDWAYMSIDQDAFAYMVMMPGAMRVNPPSWVVPHELGHVFTYHNGGKVPYEWYEAIANFMRNEYLASEYYSYNGTIYGPDSDFFAPFIMNAESHFPHVKNWYDAWPILVYINENPDNINGLGHDAILRLLSYNQEDITYFKTIEKITGVSIKDILGSMARRLVTMDFKAQPYYLKHLNELLKSNGNVNKIYTTLEKNNDGWLHVPAYKAPQQTGFNIIPLDINLNKRSVTVDFQGNSTVKGADWRVSIIAVSHSGTTRYSTMWSQGKNTLSLQGNEKVVYLVVSATPDEIKHLSIEEDGIKFPYKVKISTK